MQGEQHALVAPKPRRELTLTRSATTRTNPLRAAKCSGVIPSNGSWSFTWTSTSETVCSLAYVRGEAHIAEAVFEQ